MGVSVLVSTTSTSVLVDVAVLAYLDLASHVLQDYSRAAYGEGEECFMKVKVQSFFQGNYIQ
jgi:hypothetical protein